MPVRQCIACRRRGDKPTLVRLVVADSNVGVDPLATMPGRGAYLCGRTACTDVALRRDGALLRRALRVRDRRVTVDGARLAVACAAAAAVRHVFEGADRTAGDDQGTAAVVERHAQDGPQGSDALRGVSE